MTDENTTTDDQGLDNSLLEKIEMLEDQLLAAQNQVAEAENSKMRALADLQNQQRREAENRAKWGEMSVVSFLSKVLPNFLELRLAQEHTADEAVKSVIEKFFGTLDGAGISTIQPQAGELLDTHVHEVMMIAEGEPGKIVLCLEPGWKYGESVIIPAKVSAAASS